jgi:peptide/nickel transport system substrate-binding protein
MTKQSNGTPRPSRTPLHIEVGRRQFLLSTAAFGVISGLGLVGCSVNDSASSPGSSSTVTIDTELEPRSLNGLDENDQYLAWIYQQVQESLYVYDSSFNPMPWLAQSLPVMVDTLTAEVTLRSGIMFQNGDEFTADDVAATMNVGKTPGHVWNFHLGPLKNATAVSKYKVRFTFNQPWALLTDKLTVIPMMNKDYVNRNDTMMGTGPFKFVQHNQGVSVELAGWDKYRLGAPKIDKVVFRFVTDPSARLVDIRNGTSTINSAPNFTDVPALTGAQGVVLVNSVAPITLAMRPNVKSAAFADERVRQAAAYSINRQKIQEIVFNGLADIGQGPIGPGNDGWEYTTQVYPSTPDLERARSLLSAAGYAGKTISFTWVATQDAMLQQLGSVLKADWAAVGLDAQLQFLQLADWLTQTGPGKPFGMMIEYDEDGTAFGRSPAPLTYALQIGNLVNTTGFDDTESNDLITQANATQDATERNKLYAQWSDMVATKGAWISPAYPRWLMAHRTQLTGLPPASFKLNELALYGASLAG